MTVQHQTLEHSKTITACIDSGAYSTFSIASLGIKVAGNAWERRSQARHSCNLVFPGLKGRFFSVETHVLRPER